MLLLQAVTPSGTGMMVLLGMAFQRHVIERDALAHAVSWNSHARRRMRME